MKKIKIWIGVFIILGIIAIYALVASAPTEEELQAVILMETPHSMPGSNAFTDLWLMEYDIPATEKAAIMQADIQLINEPLKQRLDPGAIEESLVRESSAEGHYPKITGKPDERLYCNHVEATNCLQHVRQNQKQILENLTKDQHVLQNLADLHQHGHLQSQFVQSIEAPWPLYARLRILPTSFAADFATGLATPNKLYSVPAYIWAICDCSPSIPTA